MCHHISIFLRNQNFNCLKLVSKVFHSQVELVIFKLPLVLTYDLIIQQMLEHYPEFALLKKRKQRYYTNMT